MHLLTSTTVFIILFLASGAVSAQRSDKLGFYLQPEYSAMFLDNHLGNAVGVNVGITTKSRKLDVGIRYYGRSGPINEHQEYALVLPDGETYKDQSTLQLGADHGYIGLEAAYNVYLKEDRLLIRFPVSLGQVGAGFYLKDSDRVTPDGRRVSEWEDELQDGTDAGFGLASEVGVHLFYQPISSVDNLRVGGGLNYTNTYGYTSFLGGDDFYNNKLRVNVGLRVSF